MDRSVGYDKSFITSGSDPTQTAPLTAKEQSDQDQQSSLLVSICWKHYHRSPKFSEVPNFQTS